MGLLENCISEEIDPPPPPSSSSASQGVSLPGRRRQRAAAKEKNKIMAACTGAVVTSLTMTPFDVVKTRLQTQAAPEPLFLPSKRLPPPTRRPLKTPWPLPVASTSSIPLSPIANSSTSATNAATCCQKTYFASNVSESALLCQFDPRPTIPSPPVLNFQQTTSSTSWLSSSSGGGSARLSPYSSFLPANPVVEPVPCVYPSASVAAVQLPTQSMPSSSRHLSGFWDAVFKIVKQEGVSALWRGTAPALAMSVPGQVIYMVGYDWGRRTAFDHAPQWAYKSSTIIGETKETMTGLNTAYLTAVPLLAGSLSRAIVATIISPLELLRTRLQASTTPTSMWLMISTFRKTDGSWANAWRGLPPTLWRDVPFSGIYWAGYEGIKRQLTGGKGMGEGWEGQGAWKEFGIAFVSGAGSGMIAATLTNPFDVVKTRRQAMDNVSKPGSSKMILPTKTFAILADVAKKEGLTGLMRGLTPRLAKVGPACGIMIGCYEGISRWLD